MQKSMTKTAIFMTIVILAFIFTGCQNTSSSIDESKHTESAVSDETIYNQKELQEPKELEISEDGTVAMEIESMAEPANTLPEDKSIFLAVTAKEDTDISLQYTYDTYGKEGALFCCELKADNGTETSLEPLSSFYLSQTSKENYKDIWLTRGIFLKKGENVFYLNGKDQTFPYRMILKATFFAPEKIESVILYPAGK
ncbi:MAG: hypothetical protein Q4D60_02315 [Eubacteriales bacterium]|nr:hypothetical protein [Eubacteriales bacterium]